MNARVVVGAAAISLLTAVTLTLGALGEWPFGSKASAGPRFPAAEYVDDSGARVGAPDTIGVQGEPTRRNIVGDCGPGGGVSSGSGPACGDIVVEVPESYQYRPPPAPQPTGQDDEWDECDMVSTIYACVGDVIDLAESDLADFLSVDESSILWINIELTEWPDTCLGLQRADIACAEAVTPGFRVVLEMDERCYAYHTDFGTRVVAVESTTDPAPRCPRPQR